MKETDYIYSTEQRFENSKVAKEYAGLMRKVMPEQQVHQQEETVKIEAKTKEESWLMSTLLTAAEMNRLGLPNKDMLQTATHIFCNIQNKNIVQMLERISDKTGMTPRRMMENIVMMRRIVKTEK